MDANSAPGAGEFVLVKAAQSQSVSLWFFEEGGRREFQGCFGAGGRWNERQIRPRRGMRLAEVVQAES